MSGYSDEQIARVCHEANSALQVIDADSSPSVPWDAETAETRRSAVEGVAFARAGSTPEQQHEAWACGKEAAGWVYGPVKDPVARTHPCLIPYGQLPPEQRVKDAVFTAIVRAMSGEDS